jgi:hypothetical protein
MHRSHSERSRGTPGRNSESLSRDVSTSLDMTPQLRSLVNSREILRSAQDDKLRLSFDRAQLFEINALDPFLQFAGLLVLQFYLDEITIGDHYP